MRDRKKSLKIKNKSQNPKKSIRKSKTNKNEISLFSNNLANSLILPQKNSFINLSQNDSLFFQSQNQNFEKKNFLEKNQKNFFFENDLNFEPKFGFLDKSEYFGKISHDYHLADRIKCKFCKRKFVKERIGKHEMVCDKNKLKRKY